MEALSTRCPERTHPYPPKMVRPVRQRGTPRLGCSHAPSHRCPRRPGGPHRGGACAQREPLPVLPRRPAELQGPVVEYAGGAAALKADAAQPASTSTCTLRTRSTSPRRTTGSGSRDASCSSSTSTRRRDRREGRHRPWRTPRRGRGRRRRVRQLAQVRRRARDARAAPHREHRRRRQRHGPPARGDRAALGRHRRGEGGDTVGFCLDTCHAHAGGNDLGSVVEKVRSITGRIDLVHANDSRDELRLRRRPAHEPRLRPHRRRGPGRCHPRRGRTGRRETPGGTDGQSADIAWLRSRVD